MSSGPTTTEKLLLLRSSGVFHSVPLRDLRSVSEHLVFCRFEAGEVIFRQGDDSDAVYLVNSGRVAIEQGVTRPVRIAELGRGEILGELSVLAGHEHRRSAVAVTAAHLLAIDAETFLRLGARHPEILIGAARVLAARLNQADRWLQRARQIRSPQ